MGEDYIYGVARVHARETRLLGAGDIQQLMACKTCDECLRVLTDKGWGAGDGNASPEAMLAAEEEKTWAFLKELTQDLEPFQALLAPADYNNLKAAIKCAGTGARRRNTCSSPGGTIEPEVLLRCVQEQDFSPLPPCHGPGRRGGLPPLSEHPGWPAVRHHPGPGLPTGHPGLRGVPAAWWRSTPSWSPRRRTSRWRCGPAGPGKTRSSSGRPWSPVPPWIQTPWPRPPARAWRSSTPCWPPPPYSQAAQRLKESSSAFEKWCDDQVMERIKEEKHSYESVGPLFAYVLARRSEISTVRIILSGKLNQLDDGMIRERLRDTYV